MACSQLLELPELELPVLELAVFELPVEVVVGGFAEAGSKRSQPSVPVVGSGGNSASDVALVTASSLHLEMSAR
jgi:hypothetical protein